MRWSSCARAVREVLSRRRLIRYLVRAEIKKQGTDTVLGNVWWVLDPLISLLVYVFVMQVIFARDQPDFGVFLLAAMIPFKWFTGTVSDSVNSVVAPGPADQADPVPQDRAAHRDQRRRAGEPRLRDAGAVRLVVLLAGYRDHLT